MLTALTGETTNIAVQITDEFANTTLSILPLTRTLIHSVCLSLSQDKVLWLSIVWITNCFKTRVSMELFEFTDQVRV